MERLTNIDEDEIISTLNDIVCCRQRRRDWEWHIFPMPPLEQTLCLVQILVLMLHATDDAVISASLSGLFALLNDCNDIVLSHALVAAFPDPFPRLAELIETKHSSDAIWVWICLLETDNNVAAKVLELNVLKRLPRCGNPGPNSGILCKDVSSLAGYFITSPAHVQALLDAGTFAMMASFIEQANLNDDDDDTSIMSNVAWTFHNAICNATATQMCRLVMELNVIYIFFKVVRADLDQWRRVVQCLDGIHLLLLEGARSGRGRNTYLDMMRKEDVKFLVQLQDPDDHEIWVDEDIQDKAYCIVRECITDGGLMLHQPTTPVRVLNDIPPMPVIDRSNYAIMDENVMDKLDGLQRRLNEAGFMCNDMMQLKVARVV